MVSMRSRRPSIDPSIPVAAAAAAVGGAKTIGLVGGVALLINNITGSAMVLFPSLYQAAGWFPVTVTLCAVAFLSFVCSVMVIEAMAAMPGNHTFTKRVEYTTLAYYYLGKRGYYATQFFFQFSLAFNNMSGIILFGKSCAIPEFYPHFSFSCPSPVTGDITPFGNMYLLSIGFLLTALICAPLGFWNLDDNIIIQKASCSLVLLMVVTWVGLFIGHWGLEPDRVAAIGTNFTQVLGVVVFNFAIISSIPSWVNEKKEGVSILRTMSIAMPMALFLFTVIGVFGGLAFQPWFNTDESDETLLNKLQTSSSAIAKVTFYLFPVVVNLTSIPVFAIMQRYNLLEAKVCGKRMANFLGVVLPWLICIPFYTGSGFSNIVNWGGIIFNSTVNFIIPPLIYIQMVRKQQARAAITGSRVNMDLFPPSRGDIGARKYSDSEDEAGSYVPPGGASGSMSSVVKHHTIRVAESSRSASLLGPASSATAESSLKQGLLTAGTNYDGSGVYNPSEIDVRTAEEEARDAELLGYDPVEAERQEMMEEAEEERRLRAQHGGSSVSPTVANLQHSDILPSMDSTMSLPTSETSELHHTHTQGWRAMPAWLVPYRIHLAAGVTVLLVLISFAVLGINIEQCVTQGC